MSRRTKKDKSSQYAILENGQVVRFDTLSTTQNPVRESALGYRPSQVAYEEPDLDHTRKHREELKAQQQQATKNFSTVFGRSK